MNNPKDNKPRKSDVIGTKTAHKNAVAALKSGEWSAATVAIEDYFSILSENLAKFQIKGAGENVVDFVLKGIDDLAPHRNDAVDLFTAIARYAPTEDNIRRVHRFFELLIPYIKVNSQTWEFDNFRFFAHELFLCWVAALLKRERFVAADEFLCEHFYLGSDASYGNTSLRDYCIFDTVVQSSEQMNRRKERLCVEADLLKERANPPALEFEHLQQADLVLYIRGEIHHRCAHYSTSWYPTTLMYTTFEPPRAFEIFVRSASKKYFESSKRIFGISQKEDLLKAMQNSKEVYWRGRAINPKALLGYEQLATLP